MLNASQLDRDADLIWQSYQTFLLAQEGLYGRMTETSSGLDPLVGFRRLESDASQLMLSTLAKVTKEIMALVKDYLRAAEIDAGHDQDVRANADLGTMYYGQGHDLLRAALATDRGALLRYAMAFVMRFQTMRRHTPSGVAAEKAAHKFASDSFVQLDRLQRRRNSADFVRTALRGLLMNVYVDAFVSTLINSGRTRLRVHAPPQKADQLPFEFDVGSNEWERFRTDHLHPNARLWLEAV